MAKEKFAAHRVLDRVGYGVGVRLQLSASQIADRRHALTIEDEEAGIVTVTEPIEFRAGEEIGIAHTLSRHEEEALENLDEADEGSESDDEEGTGEQGNGDAG